MFFAYPPCIQKSRPNNHVLGTSSNHGGRYHKDINCRLNLGLFHKLGQIHLPLWNSTEADHYSPPPLSPLPIKSITLINTPLRKFFSSPTPQPINRNQGPHTNVQYLSPSNQQLNSIPRQPIFVYQHRPTRVEFPHQRFHRKAAKSPSQHQSGGTQPGQDPNLDPVTGEPIVRGQCIQERQGYYRIKRECDAKMAREAGKKHKHSISMRVFLNLRRGKRRKAGEGRGRLDLT